MSVPAGNLPATSAHTVYVVLGCVSVCDINLYLGLIRHDARRFSGAAPACPRAVHDQYGHYRYRGGAR